MRVAPALKPMSRFARAPLFQLGAAVVLATALAALLLPTSLHTLIQEHGAFQPPKADLRLRRPLLAVLAN